MEDTKKQIQIGIPVTSERWVALIGTIGFLNLWMLCGTWIFTIYFREDLGKNWDSGSGVKYVLHQFCLSTENVLAVWYSSMLLLLTSVLTLLCFVSDLQLSLSQKKRYSSYGWLVFALIFFFLSADEMGSLHERIGNISLLNPFGDYSLGWAYLLAPAIFLIGIYMLVFAWTHLRQKPASFILICIGVGLYLSNPFQEIIETKAMYSSGGPLIWDRPILFMLLEEGTELFGTLAFLSAAAIYLHYVVRQLSDSNLAQKLYLRLSINLKSSVIGILIFIGLFSLLMFATEWLVQNTQSGDIGIVKNWFPSALAFLTMLICFHLSKMIPETKKTQKWQYLTLTLFCLLISMYFGANLPAYLFWDKLSFVGRWIHNTFLIIALILAVQLFLSVKTWWSRVATIAWVVGLYISFRSGYASLTYFSVFAFSCLLIALLSHLYRWQAPANFGYSSQEYPTTSNSLPLSNTNLK